MESIKTERPIGPRFTQEEWETITAHCSENEMKISGFFRLAALEKIKRAQKARK